MKTAQFYIVTALGLISLGLALVTLSMRDKAAEKRALLREQQVLIARGDNAQQSFVNIAKELAYYSRSSEKIAGLLKKYNVTVTGNDENAAPAAADTAP